MSKVIHNIPTKCVVLTDYEAWAELLKDGPILIEATPKMLQLFNSWCRSKRMSMSYQFYFEGVYKTELKQFEVKK